VAAAMGARGRPLLFHAQHYLGNSLAAKAARSAIRYARSTVIADARHVGAQYARHVAPERLHVVYNGVPEMTFVKRDFSSQHLWRIGMIGRIAPMKGQTDFLRAAALLMQGQLDARFTICGAPMFCSSDYFGEVQRLAEGLPVDFPGWSNDVGAALAGLDLLVVPSTQTEATTRVILEAFSAGVPVVAYAAGGIPEIVQDGWNGFLVRECEPAALARRILEVTRLDLAAVAARARQDWERNYTLARYREQMTGIIAASAATS